jgi:hypothetical protein
LFLIKLRGWLFHVFGLSRNIVKKSGWTSTAVPGLEVTDTGLGRLCPVHPLANDARVLDVLFRLNVKFEPSVLIDAVRLGRGEVVAWFLDGSGRWDAEEDNGAKADSADLQTLEDDIKVNFADLERGLVRRDSAASVNSSEDLVSVAIASPPDDLDEQEARSYLSSPSFLIGVVLTHAVSANDYRLVSFVLRHPLLRQAHAIKPLDVTEYLLSCSRKGHLAILRLLLSVSLPSPPPPVPSFASTLKQYLTIAPGTLQSLLRTASARNQPLIVSFLLSTSLSDPNDDLGGTDNPPLSHAAWRGFTDVVRALLEGGARPDNLSLFLASSRGHVDCMRLMVNKGARPGEDLMWYSGSRSLDQVVRFLIEECGVPVQGCCNMWRVGGRADVANWVERIKLEADGRKLEKAGRGWGGDKGKQVVRDTILATTEGRRTPVLSRSSSSSSSGSLRATSGHVSIDALIDAILPDAPTSMPSSMFDPASHNGWFDAPNNPISPANLAQNYPALAPSPVVTLKVPMPQVMVTAPTPTSYGSANREPKHDLEDDLKIAAHLTLAPPREDEGKSDNGARAACPVRKRGGVVYFDDEDEIVTEPVVAEPKKEYSWGWNDPVGDWVDVTEEYLPERGRRKERVEAVVGFAETMDVWKAGSVERSKSSGSVDGKFYGPSGSSGQAGKKTWGQW